MATITDEIKKAAIDNGTKIQNSEEAFLEKLFNKMFYLEKNRDEETKFVRQMITRGQETQERKGLHASAIIVSDNKFCIRQQVLSLLYKQLQGEQIGAGLMRIFEAGNAIHEKWQRLFIRAGYGKAEDMDYSQFHDEFEVSFTPDAILKIPEFNAFTKYDGKLICEIKSVNTFQFKKMTSHPSGRKQMQFYMHLTGIHKGFVLCEDKNTQEFKIFLENYDPEIVKPFVERCKEIKYRKQRALNGFMVKRCKGCNKYTCKTAESCAMKDACYNRGIGRVRLD